MPQIMLNGIALNTPAIPDPLPTQDRPARLKAYWMSTGAGGAGLRCLRRLGSHASYSDWSFKIGYLVPLDVASLQSAHDNQSVMTLIVGGVSYSVIFAEGGFKTHLAKRQKYFEDPLFSGGAERPFYSADVHLHVLAQTG